jgi:hypothetical protein
VAVAVVVGLEPVEVDQDERRAAAVAAHARQLRVERFGEEVVVAKAGEPVGERPSPQLAPGAGLTLQELAAQGRGDREADPDRDGDRGGQHRGAHEQPAETGAGEPGQADRDRQASGPAGSGEDPRRRVCGDGNDRDRGTAALALDRPKHGRTLVRPSDGAAAR